MNTDTETFFSALLGSRGYLKLSFRDPIKPPGQNWTQRLYQFPEVLAKVDGILAAHGDRFDPYFSPMLYQTSENGTEANVQAELHTLWADLDSCHPGTCRVRPTIAVESSPGRYHGYWLLVDPLPKAQVADLNRRIAYFHAKDGADKSGWDLSQVLRIPGTRNLKYEDATVRLLWWEHQLYRPSDFADYPEVGRPTSGHQGLPELIEPPNPRPAWFTGIIDENRDSDRSAEPWRIMCRGFELGYPEGMTLSMVYESPRFRDKYQGREDEQAETLLNKARALHPHTSPDTCWDTPTPGEKCLEHRERGDEPHYAYKHTLLRLKPEQEPANFVIYGPEDHAQPVPPMQWLIKNVWPDCSFGPLGGAKKTFKSYTALSMSVAVGSGKPFFGEFPVMRSGPVLYFVGEGGYKSWRRRYQRMCAAYGVSPTDAPVYAIDKIYPVDSKQFAEMLNSVRFSYEPIAVVLDPMYAYHPKDIEAQNLYDRGRMLANLRDLIGEDTALIIPDHYRKNGESKLDLDEIGQSGMAQWADSWILQVHRKAYDFETGTAFLEVEFGSREGYGRRKYLDFTVGTFNEETGDHEGEISWCVSSASKDRPSTGGAEVHNDTTLRARLYRLLDNPKFAEPANKSFTKAQGVAMLRSIFEIGKTQGYDRFADCVDKNIFVEFAKGRFIVGPGPS